MTESQTKICQNCHGSFVIEPEDFTFYKKISVPPPTWCPMCRFKRRLAFRNEKYLHRRSCGLCSKKIISVYAEDVKFPVYCQKCWWSDEWDPRDYSIDYDANRKFLEQFEELHNNIPHEAMHGYNNVNCEYSNNVIHSKDAYLSSVIIKSENILYSRFTIESRDCISCFYVTQCEECIRTFRGGFCSRCVDCNVVENCTDMYFTSHSTGCSFCYGCINLRNKKYYIFNESYSKEEYHNRLNKLLKLPYDEQKRQVDEFYKTQIQRGSIFFHSTNVSGQEIYYSKNIRHSTMLNFVSDSAYCFEATSYSRNNETVNNLYDCDIVADIAWGYEIGAGGKSHNVKFGIITDDSINLEYSMFCYGCEDMFGCFGMRKMKYGILNKIYTKEEYEKLKKQIVAEMIKTNDYGEFFPTSLSPFAYNETLGSIFFPLTKEDAIRQGYKWRESPERNYQIGRDVLQCEHNESCNENCTKAFRVMPYEKQLAQKLKVQLPLTCPNCRFAEQLRNLKFFQLNKRRCQCDYGVYKNFTQHQHHPEGRCPNEFETSYSLERKETVYCEECYQAEVV